MWFIRNGNYLSRGVANLHQTTEFCPLQEEFFLVCVAKIGLTWLLLSLHLLISRGSYRAEISVVILTLWRAGLHYVNSVQFSHSVMSDSVTLWTAVHQVSLSITNSQSLFKLMPIESVVPSNHLILCRPLLLLPSVFPSFRVFSNELALHIRWPKYWNFSFSISPSNEYLGKLPLSLYSAACSFPLLYLLPFRLYIY